MTWNSIFKEELKTEGSLLAYYTSCLIQNWYFICKIRQYPKSSSLKAPSWLTISSSILEAGAGRGFLAIYLASLGYKVCALDTDTRFLEEAKAHFKSDISILQHDITYIHPPPTRYNLIYNIGVMEHFNDENIAWAFRNFRSMADRLIFAVPNFKIPCSFGDERYLSRRHWRKLLKSEGWEIKEIFTYNRHKLRKYLTGFVCE